jgi:hypothetical protein
MKIFLFFIFFLSFSFASFSQGAGAATYSYNFGTNATNSKSTKEKQINFFSTATNPLNTPTGGGTYQVDFHSDPPNTALVGLITSSGPSTITSTSVPYFPSDFGSGTRMYLRGERGDVRDPASSSSFSIYNITGANSSISVAFDFYINKAGTDAANQDGEIVFMIGNDNNTNNKGFQQGHLHGFTEYDASSIFMGLKIKIENGATTATTWKNDRTWNTTNLTNSAWSGISSGKHRMFILANNAASGSATYSFSNGTSSTVGAKTFDIYLDGVIIENDISVVGELADGTSLNSFRFDVGYNSNAQNITLLLDNLSYQMSANGAQAALLPVTLTSFTAKPTTENKVALAWVTSSESVNKGFRIERQEEGSGKFQSLGFIASKAEGGNSQTTLAYSFKDVTAKNGTNMYRLVQEDLDGTKTYSEVRLVKLNGQSVSMVFPNPSIGAVNISRTADGKKMNIQLIDQSGKIIKQVSNITDANYKLNIQKSGVYTIKMTYPETGEQSIQRVVVQK